MSNEFINLGSANSRPEDFNLRYISISKYEDDWHSLPHTHQFSELFYVLRGEGIFYIEDKKVSMKTDDLMIINPYVEHTEKTLPNNPMEYIVFGVEGLAFSFNDPDQDGTQGYSFYLGYERCLCFQGFHYLQSSLNSKAPSQTYFRSL